MNFFALLLAALSLAETDCNKVRSYLYPDAAVCTDEMKCSEEYACVVSDSCDAYGCVAATDCPADTNYTVFNQQGSDENDSGHETNGLDGYFCDPNGDGLICTFDDEGNFYIDAIINNKRPWVNGPDDDDEKRKVTLISKTKHDQQVPETAFKQFNNSTCVGETIENGSKVRFNINVNDPNCTDEFDFSHIISPINGLTYIVDFYIGFDDYWYINEFGDERILRGGVSNQFQCRLKASDYGWVDPNPQSNRAYNYTESEAQIPFTFTAYNDRQFSDEYDGSIIELDDEFEYNGLYIEAEHEATGEFQSHIMHLRECTSHNYPKVGEDTDGNPIYSNSSTTFAFVNDGCIDNNFVTYSQKSTRTEWTSNIKTTVKDQFNLRVNAASGANGAMIKYSCEMVLCPLDVFEDSVVGSPCHLSDQCPNRYDNLFSRRRRRTSLANDNNVLIKTIHQEGAFFVRGNEAGNGAKSGNDAFAIGLAIACLLFFAL
ncbi:Oidioi.mRNA.OKI2018_I69.chr1.g1938.t1.cds [Oikopleura dioica]|uniref:Oidioi.mRNA.OKI2018_I69.chr1.g1938.t1.cds n=1 Tax=Oikopleura dioica TaxID=34765 RepID=A0ABN7STR5_OIKDI|nr:Oidioi.mRNA.OKI2018_I69.chr1.g1938.t1.cds [Oikopleura dioica]